MDVRGARLARGWSQEELAARTGLSVRTVQRVENGGRPGLATARLLADALGLDVAELATADDAEPGTSDASPKGRWDQTEAVVSVREGLLGFSDFHGVARRPEYWWFALAVLLVTAATNALSRPLGTAVAVVLLLPLLAAGARRLHDTGRSGWWQLFALVPFGFVIPAILLAGPTRSGPASGDAEEAADRGRDDGSHHLNR